MSKKNFLNFHHLSFDRALSGTWSISNITFCIVTSLNISEQGFALLQYQKKYGWVQKSCMFLWIEAEDK